MNQGSPCGTDIGAQAAFDTVFGPKGPALFEDVVFGEAAKKIDFQFNRANSVALTAVGAGRILKKPYIRRGLDGNGHGV